MLKNAPMRLLAVSCGTKDTTKAHVHPRNCLDTRNTEETRHGRKRIRIATHQRKLALKKRQLVLKVDAKKDSEHRLIKSMAKTVVRNKYKKAIKKAERQEN